MKKTEQEGLRKRIDLEAEDVRSEPHVALREMQKIDDFSQVYSLAEHAHSDSELPFIDSRKRRWSLWFIAAVGLLSVAELGLFLWESWQATDLLALAWVGCLLVFIAGATHAFLREWRSLGQLRASERLRQDVNNAFNAPGIGLAEPLTKTALGLLSSGESHGVEAYNQALQAHYNDREVLLLFEQKVIAPIDEQVLAIISRHASASAVMIAVSPFALLDMAIVLWRNFNMLGEISAAYGLKLSYWGKVRLIKSVFRTMLVAGASELAADAGNYMLTSSVTGKLSTRLAQGLGVGVMTARIGLKASNACRPVPWLGCKKPGIQELSQHTLEQLKALVKR